MISWTWTVCLHWPIWTVCWLDQTFIRLPTFLQALRSWPLLNKLWKYEQSQLSLNSLSLESTDSRNTSFDRLLLLSKGSLRDTYRREPRLCIGFFIAESTHRRQETLLKSVSQIWGLDKLEGTGWHVVMLVGQVLIGRFWSLANCGTELRGKRKHKGILIWQSLIYQIYISSYLA